jgi:ATP-dependent DNA helicase RecQ
VAPERLQSEIFMEKLRQLPIQWIVVDEAHCISEWGHDFRPSYLEIHKIRDVFPHVPVAAFTATATHQVMEDISVHLKLKEPVIFKKTLVRHNLSLKVIETQDKWGELWSQLHQSEGSAIVYAGSRKNVEHIAGFLNHKGLHTAYYHAGMDQESKDVSYQKWMQNKSPIMVATNAFGMGIDKPDVRKVIHVNLPSSLENYTQEAGRAGRDGKLSEGIIIEEPADFLDSKSIYFGNLPDGNFIKKTYHNLNRHFQITYGDLSEKIYDFDINAFCQHFGVSVVKTYYSLEILEREGVLQFQSSKELFHSVKIIATTEQLYDYYQRNKLHEKVLKVLLRNYEGLFENVAVINPFILAKQMDISAAQTIDELQRMHKQGIIKYQFTERNHTLQFLVPREDDYTLNRIMNSVNKRIVVKREKYEVMLGYVSQKKKCRMVYIGEYFGAKNVKDCGICDICLSKNDKEVMPTPSKLWEFIKENQPISLKEISILTGITLGILVPIIRELLDDGRIVVDLQNQYSIVEK